MRLRFAILAGLTLSLSAAADEPHWAFQPPKRPALPANGHPIDAFLNVERARHGLTPRPPADRRTLIRRVYLDLIGLPPTPEEVSAFLNDAAPDAYEKVVDRLLASPRYGERWGRHWMDVWRYSDWDGFGAEVRNSQPHLWHWRDWIVESLNADKGYDRMVLEMLAGDELAPDDPATVRATGFLARNWFKFNRNIWLETTVEHTSKAFLGLTMNCARCHDHKYDPVSQPEYFEFRAIFEPHDVRMDRVPGQPDPAKDGIPRVYDAKPLEPTYLFRRGDEAKPDRTKALPPALPAFLGAKLSVTPVTLSRTAQAPDKREFVVRETLAQSEQAVAAARVALAKALAAPLAPPPHPLFLAANAPRTAAAIARAEIDLTLAEANDAALKAVLRAERLEDDGRKNSPQWQQAAKDAVTHQRAAALAEARKNLLLARQERNKAVKPAIDAADKKIVAAQMALTKAEQAAKSPPTVAFTPRAQAILPPASTGRRLALARWMVSRDNPLAARVAVNHVWMRHFGRPLVPTVFDFGRNGQPPTHPELLDWLACDLMASGGSDSPGWRMKPLHRLIVTSAAYRMDSSPDPDALARDPEDRWLWRFAPRRLEAEAVRDAVLSAAGNLDLTMGGPDLDQSLGLTVPRRSIYFRHSVEKYVEMLKLFDAANVVDCYRRDESIVPQQALALANNSLVLAQARLLARKLAGANPAPDAFAAAAYERLLGRPPRPDESAECVKFLSRQAELLATRATLSAFTSGPPCPVPPSADPALRAREDLIHVLFNHHEFVTLR